MDERYIIKLENTVIRALEIKWFVEPVSACIRHTMWDTDKGDRTAFKLVMKC